MLFLVFLRNLEAFFRFLAALFFFFFTDFSYGFPTNLKREIERSKKKTETSINVESNQCIQEETSVTSLNVAETPKIHITEAKPDNHTGKRFE